MAPAAGGLIISRWLKRDHFHTQLHPKYLLAQHYNTTPSIYCELFTPHVIG